MKEPSIRLSPRHGLNPAIPICFYCGEEKNEIIIAGHLRGDEQAPHHAVWDRIPCDECRDWMKQGVILISVKDGCPAAINPHRTGGWCVVKDNFIHEMRKVMKEESKTSLDSALRHRVMFLEDRVWSMLGLPADYLTPGESTPGGTESCEEQPGD